MKRGIALVILLVASFGAIYYWKWTSELTAKATRESAIAATAKAAHEISAKAELDFRKGVEKDLRLMVANRTRDPDSAEFRDTHLYYTNWKHGTKSGMFVLCGEVNAKNSFGGYVGYTKFISDVWWSESKGFNPAFKGAVLDIPSERGFFVQQSDECADKED